MEQDQNQRVNNHVALLLTDRLKTAWRNFIEEFQQTFDLVQLDPVLSLLRELDSTSSNPEKKNQLEFIQKRDGESQDNNNDDNLSSLEKKVFGNHLLAKSVFKYLSHSDLLSCRLINSYWNEYATEILLDTDFKIKFRARVNRFYFNGSNWKSLDMFTQLLRTSKTFPCNKFEFWGGNLGNDDAQRFFSFYGSSITFLGISFWNNQVYKKNVMDNETGFSLSLTDSRVIGTILSQQLPNLEHLHLALSYSRGHEWSGHTSLLFPRRKEVKLPKLKKLEYNSNRRGDDALLRQLLLAATNLERFAIAKDSFDLMKDLNVFIQTGKVKCISDLLFPMEAEELDKLEEMVKYEPKLTYLAIYDESGSEVYDHRETWKKRSIVLTKLLESCKNSLNQIHGFASLGFLRQLQLPILENVKHLDLEVLIQSAFNLQDLHGYSFSILPRGATFSRNFPRLSSLSFWIGPYISDEDAAEWWSKCFPPDEIVPSVKNLNIRKDCPLLWMEKFSEMFPNLEELSAAHIQDFPNVSKIIWTSCRKLKNLTIGIDLSSPFNAHPALDSSFTGLSPKMCKKLGKFSPSVLESVAENYMENEPSLLDLTELRTLVINLEFSDKSNYKYAPILTPLTGICVFKPMESLREVNIKFSTLYNPQLNETLIQRNLEPLTLYKVNIQNTNELSW